MRPTVAPRDLELQRHLFRIRLGNRIVRLERRVFDLVAYLIDSHERVVPKEELLREVWKGRKVTEASLTVAIAAARKALEVNPSKPSLITTHHGRGYRFRIDRTRLGPDTKAVERNSVASSNFIGRTNEAALLTDLLDGAIRGQTELTVVIGEAGIGKTRFIEEIGERARARQATVLSGRCREEEGAPPYWPWIQMIRQCVSGADAENVRDVLGPEVDELARLVPELAGASTSIDRPVALEGREARFRLFEGVLRWLERTANRHPLVLLLDDIHRADHASLLLLEFVVDQATALPMLVVCSQRPVGRQHDDLRARLIGEIARRAAAHVLALRGFSIEETSEYIEATSGWRASRSAAQMLVDLTAGNPFFLSQVVPLAHRTRERDLGQLATQLPQTVREALLRQVEVVSQPALEMLRLASVIGREFAADTLEIAGRYDPDRVAEALDEASAAGLVQSAGGGGTAYRFSHILVRDVLYFGLPSAQRRRAHRELATALEGAGSEGGISKSSVAYHYSEGVDRATAGLAIAACERAAVEAAERFAYEEAIAHYTKALEASVRFGMGSRERCDLLLGLATQQVRSGNRIEAKGTFEVAAALAEQLGETERLARAALGIAPGFFAIEADVRDDFSVGLLRRVLDLLGRSDSELRSKVAARLGMALFWSEEGREGSVLSRQAWEASRSTRDAALRLYMLTARWFAEWTPFNIEERRTIAEDGIRAARDLRDLEALALCRLFRLVGLLEVGDLCSFDQESIDFAAAASATRQPQALWYVELIKAARALHVGELARAEAAWERFYELGRRAGDANSYHSMMAQRLQEAILRRGPTEAWRISEEARRRYPMFIGWRAACCWALAKVGRHEEARRELDSVKRMGFSRIPQKMDWPTAMVLFADAARLAGDAEASSELQDLLLPLADYVVVLGLCVMTWGAGSRYVGLAAEGQGRIEEAAGWYARAVRENRRAGASAWLAASELDLARVTRAAGKTKEASLLAESALQRARRLGMRELDQSDGGRAD
jgi:DNA-binding winged helix-turn-helix (wHTH) protein/tetratricopeptide (TPR) repeat protein